MPVKKNERKNGKEKRIRFSFLSDMNPERKTALLKYAGVAVFVFTLFTFVATVSYLFTWKADSSLMSHPDMMDSSVDVMNWGGKIGYRWSHFLVSECFGLGSFALIFLMGAVSFRLFFRGRSIGLLKTAFLAVCGTFLSSLILSFCSLQFGPDLFFGGGLGGDAGQAVVRWLENMLGPIVTGCVLIVLVIAWMLGASGRFTYWFAALGEKSADRQDAECGGVAESDEASMLSEEPVFSETESDMTEVPADRGAGEGGQEEIRMEEPGVVEIENPASEKYDGVPEGGELELGGRDTSGENLTGDNAGGGLGGNGTVNTEKKLGKNGDMEVIIDDDFPDIVTEELPRIDNREELEKYEFPPLDLLGDYSDKRHKVSKLELDINNNRIRATLLNYKIEVEKVTAVVGPTVTLYKVVPAPGVRVSAIESLHREIAMSLGASGVRVVTLPDCVGIEVPNSVPSIVPLKAMLNDDSFRNSKYELPVAIGYTITQEVKTFDLTDAPHLLVAGATKQGKSVGLNVIIASLIYAKHPSELKFIFIDPKQVEFTAYRSLLKHYLAVLPLATGDEDERENAIINDSQQAEQVLNSLCIEMDERYALMKRAEVNQLKLYNDKYRDRYLLPTEGHKYLPYLVVVIDEYADLLMAGTGPDAKKSAKNIETSIIRLAQKGRAAGIHVIIATQRPTVNVITGLIKANFPTRIAFRVLSSMDSRTILDSNGAENLIGKGDMLYYAGVQMERVQCALISNEEVSKINSFIGSQTAWKQCYSTPYYLPVPVSQDGESGGGSIDMQNIDPLFEDAARMIVTSQRGSTSDLQRRMGMGYARAGRVMDQLEAAGIVGPQDGPKARKVLVSTFEELDTILSAFVK